MFNSDKSSDLKIKLSRFPIVKCTNGESVLYNGKKLYSWQYSPVDYEQLTDTIIESISGELNNLVKSLDYDKWIKLYSWNGRKYVTSESSELALPSCEFLPCNAIDSFFYGNQISDINFYSNYLTVGTEYWRYINVEVPFDEVYFDFFRDCGCDYILSISGTSDEYSKLKLNQVRRAQANSINSSSHQNHEGELAYTEANKLLRNIAEDNERLVKSSLLFVVKGGSLEELNSSTKKLFSTTLKGCKAFIETDSLPHSFAYSLMGVYPSFLKHFSSTSNYVSNLIPFKRSFLDCDGVRLLDRSMREEIFYDFLNPNLINNHCLITGASGSGKSFFVGSIIADLVQRKHAVAVFDFGNSFGRLVKFLGGVNLHKLINPMQFKDDPVFLKNFIMSFLDSRNMNRLENGKLFTAVEAALELKPKKFSELIFLMEKTYPNLSLYFCEIWDFFTDEIVDIPDLFFVDTKGISEYLIAPYLVFAKKLIESSGRNYVSVFDECYVFFDKCPDIIKTSVKSERKEGNKNIFITQEVVELQRDYSRVADAIIGNTETKIFFQQKDTSHPVLTNFQRSRIELLKSKKDSYSEMFISNSISNKIARLVVSPLMYELCHTENKKRRTQEKFIAEYEPIIGFNNSILKWVDKIYEA